jgi:hypothetical protein
MLKLNYNSKVVTSRNVEKKDLVNGYLASNLNMIEAQKPIKIKIV